MIPLPLLADEPASEFSSFSKPRPAEARTGPVDRFEWERRTRSANSFGPAVLLPPETALLDAAKAGRWSEVLDLVRNSQANANARDELGANALGLAARSGQDELVRELLRRGANADRTGADGFTPLGAAAFYGHRSTVRLLIKQGANPQIYGATGNSPLHLAAMAGRVGVIDELLRSGVNPRALNRDGDNALDVAANRGQQDAMGRLIEAGVDPAASGR